MIKFKAIKPATKFKSSIFREELRTAAAAIAPKIQKDFEKTVATWKEKPEFKTEIAVGNAAGKVARKANVTHAQSGVAISVTTDSDIYRFVDEGTKVRYATMSKDFQAKTRPKVIGSRAGRGRKLFVNRKRPRPGIKGRKFSKTIAQRQNKPFRSAMDSALTRAAKKSGHSR